MSALTDLLDTLAGLEARIKGLHRLASPVRAKATAMFLERFLDEGVDRVVRDVAVVSLVKPSAYLDVTQPETVCTWLAEQGRDDLIVRRVEVTDQAGLLAWLAGDPTPWVGEVGRDWDPDEPPPQYDVAMLRTCLDVRSQPVADLAEHLTFQATADGTCVTPDGEAIPGVRWVKPEPDKIQVRVTPDTQSAVTALLAAELNLGQS